MRLILWIGILVCIPVAGFAQSVEDNLNWSRQADAALAELDYKTAAKLANQMGDAPAANEFRRAAADTLLRCGDAKRAVVLFEAYLQERPEARPYLWQLGIAYYFEGKFKAGAKLFEVHREVNPNDVENAAWHFLCVAKSDSAAKAKELLLPAPDDSRAPMEQVLEMLKSGDTAAVEQRMNAFAENDARGKSAKFYGNFYLGLYADALGDRPTALRHLELSALGAPRNYMGDVAKVYARVLKPQTEQQ